MANGGCWILKRAYRSLARVDVAALLILVVLLVAVLGSFFPQLSLSVAADPERLARWEAVLRARDGTLADLLAASGAFRWFHSPFFLLPVALLTLTTLVCTLQRWRAVWRRSLHQPVRCSDAAFERAPHTARLSVAPGAPLVRVVRESLQRRGFRVRSAAAGDTVYLRGDRNRLSGLATLVTHLAVLLLLLGMALSGVYGWREEVTVGPDEMIEVGHGTELAVRNDGFVIQRYADGSVASYEAEVGLTRGSREVACGSVRVNGPLSYGGLALVLRGYGAVEEGHSVTLLVVCDPGYGPVIVAGFLMLLGLSVGFNFPRCRVHARVGPGEMVRLAGWSERRAWGFERDFAALVGELKQAAEG
jgi:cytochrome c biogenesis protein ResB